MPADFSNMVEGALTSSGRKTWRFTSGKWDLISTPDQAATDIILSVEAAAESAAESEASRQAIDNRIYPGVYASPPTTRPNGQGMDEGDEYQDTEGHRYYRHSQNWRAYADQGIEYWQKFSAIGVNQWIIEPPHTGVIQLLTKAAVDGRMVDLDIYFNNVVGNTVYLTSPLLPGSKEVIFWFIE